MATRTTFAESVLCTALLMAAAVGMAAAAALSSDQKLIKLNEAAARYPLLNFDGKDFDRFTDGHRNFSLLIMLTAMSQGCEPCKIMYPSFEIAANSWAALNEPNRMYFAVLDYTRGPEIFNRLKLQSAPVIVHYPPTQGKLSKPEHQNDPSKSDKYDIMRMGLEPEDFIRWVESIAGKEIPLIKPFDYAKLLTFLFFVGSLGLIVRFVSKHLMTYLRQPMIWGLFSVLFTLIMISGHMWNNIRGAPFSGQREVIAPQFQSQYVIETRIVAFAYGSAVLAMILMILHVPRVADANLRRLFGYAYTVFFFVVCSGIVYLFRLKYHGYPFKLLF